MLYFQSLNSTATTFSNANTSIFPTLASLSKQANKKRRLQELIEEMKEQDEEDKQVEKLKRKKVVCSFVDKSSKCSHFKIGLLNF